MTDFDEMQLNFVEEDFLLRSKELHDYHLNNNLLSNISQKSMALTRGAYFWMLPILM